MKLSLTKFILVVSSAALVEVVAGGCSEDGQKVHVHLNSLISREDLDMVNKYLE